MSKWTKRKRKAATKRGWETRRRNQRREFLRRSKAAKKGWRRRKAKAKIEREARAKLAKRSGPLLEFLVTWVYRAKEGPPRQVDFTVIARSEQDALLFTVKAVAEGKDSEGTDLTWMNSIPWDETYAAKTEESDYDKKQIKAFGDGYVSVN